MTITKEQRVPRGRPKIYDFKTKQEYFRHYYKNNRDKWNHDFFCNTCELYSSFANKSRHNKSKFHLDRLKDAPTSSAGLPKTNPTIKDEEPLCFVIQPITAQTIETPAAQAIESLVVQNEVKE